MVVLLMNENTRILIKSGGTMSTMYVLLMKLKYALSDSQKWREQSVMIVLLMKWNYALALPEVRIGVNMSSMIALLMKW